MAQGQINVNARGLIEALNDIASEARSLGADEVAKRAGVKPSIVRKFIADVMQSKNSDVRKIRNAVTEMLAEKAASAEQEKK